MSHWLLTTWRRKPGGRRNSRERTWTPCLRSLSKGGKLTVTLSRYFPQTPGIDLPPSGAPQLPSYGAEIQNQSSYYFVVDFPTRRLSLMHSHLCRYVESFSTNVFNEVIKWHLMRKRHKQCFALEAYGFLWRECWNLPLLKPLLWLRIYRRRTPFSIGSALNFEHSLLKSCIFLPYEGTSVFRFFFWNIMWWIGNKWFLCLICRQM